MLTLLEKLCNAFGPSGYEDEVRAIIIDEIKDYATSYRVDAVGNLIVFKKGRKVPSYKRLFSAHMDEVGFMITHIDKDGYACIDSVGGIDRRVVAGRRVIVGDKRVNGVIAAKPIHLQPAAERGICIPVEKSYIDVCTNSAEETEKLFGIGDLASFVPNFELFGDGRVKSKAIDDRFGCAVLADMIKTDLEYDTYFAFCICEETGCRGALGVAFSEKADFVCVVEATTAGDIHGAPKSQYGCIQGEGAVISFMDGGTVYDKELVRRIMTLAEENGIKAQLKNLAVGGNDAQAYQKVPCATKVLAVSAPARYIHSPAATAKISDLEDIRALLLFLANNEINIGGQTNA